MILYFSATGNSQYAAEKLAAATGDRLISIGQALRDGHFDYDITKDDRLGFVVPTFAWTLPGAVALFIEKLNLTGYGSQYVYGVFTCGESTGGEGAALNALLKTKGVILNQTFDLVMPDNFIIWSDVPAPARLDSILKNADKALERIVETIKSKMQGKIDMSAPKDLYMPMAEISSSKKTSKFYADDKCISCGLCMELCPMRCIKPDDAGRPLWEGICTMCLACLHRCPAAAIQHGNDTQKKGRYVNPNAKPPAGNKYD
jgi:NAD-dependent dihydropyrimidine dehydrogenase PreA subunit/flavodoxin